MGFVKYSRMYRAGWVFHLISPGSVAGDIEKVALDNIRQLDIRGIIDGLDDPVITERLQVTGLPSFTHNPSQKEPFGKYNGAPNNSKIGEMGAAHFLDKHFVNFAFCGTPINWSQERGTAFINAIVNAGYRVDIYQQPRFRGRYSWEKELPYLTKWLKSLTKPVGLMTDSDDRGQQILEACQVAGVKVPEEAAVLGVGDDDFICELTNPSMSSIRVNAENVGYQVAILLDRLINGENLPPQTIVSQPIGVTERQSTDILAVEDEVVKQAVRFIRLNSTKPLTVTDIAEAVSTTPRTLERRFRKSLNRTVNTEISHTRIEQVCRLLAETDLSTSKIAYQLGFSDPGNLNRAFKREKSIAPSAYRKLHRIT